MRLASAFALGIGFVVKIERQHLVLLISSGENIAGITVFALCQLFEKAILISESVIFCRAEIQAQPLRQFKQSLLPFTRLNSTVNGANRGHDEHGDNHKWHDEWHLDLHATLLSQNRGPGHYNFNPFLHPGDHPAGKTRFEL